MDWTPSTMESDMVINIQNNMHFAAKQLEIQSAAPALDYLNGPIKNEHSHRR